MAFMYIKELSALAAAPQNNDIAVLAEPDGVVTEQKIAIAVGNTASAAFQPTTKWIEVSVDAICSYVIGASSPTAAVTNARLAAGERVIRRVNPGGFIANIQNT